MSELEPEELAEMWREFVSGGRSSKSLKDTLTTHYFPMTRKVAAKQAQAYPSHVDRDSLESWATQGLMRAVDNYDPVPRGDNVRPVSFETYAVASMKSVIMDGVRKLDWAPRSLRKKAKDLSVARSELEQQVHTRPSDAEAAEKLGWTEAEVRKVDAEVAVSWHSYIEERPEAYEHHHELPAEESEVAVSLRVAMVAEFGRLSEIAQVVVALHYFEEHSLEEIAGLIGVAKSYVESIHAAAVLQIHEAMLGSMGVGVLRS